MDNASHGLERNLKCLVVTWKEHGQNHIIVISTKTIDIQSYSHTDAFELA